MNLNIALPLDGLKISVKTIITKFFEKLMNYLMFVTEFNIIFVNTEND